MKTHERVIQSIKKCEIIGKTKISIWIGSAKKISENLPKDYIKYYDKLIENEINKVEMDKFWCVIELHLIDGLNYTNDKLD